MDIYRFQNTKFLWIFGKIKLIDTHRCIYSSSAVLVILCSVTHQRAAFAYKGVSFPFYIIRPWPVFRQIFRPTLALPWFSTGPAAFFHPLWRQFSLYGNAALVEKCRIRYLKQWGCYSPMLDWMSQAEEMLSSSVGLSTYMVGGGEINISYQKDIEYQPFGSPPGSLPLFWLCSNLVLIGYRLTPLLLIFIAWSFLSNLVAKQFRRQFCQASNFKPFRLLPPPPRSVMFLTECGSSVAPSAF